MDENKLKDNILSIVARSTDGTKMDASCANEIFNLCRDYFNKQGEGDEWWVAIYYDEDGIPGAEEGLYGSKRAAQMSYPNADLYRRLPIPKQESEREKFISELKFYSDRASSELEKRLLKRAAEELEKDQASDNLEPFVR